MTKFWSEFLLCCGVENTISCYRKNENFDLINNFTIYLEGIISNLIITDEIEHVIIKFSF